MNFAVIRRNAPIILLALAVLMLAAGMLIVYMDVEVGMNPIYLIAGAMVMGVPGIVWCGIILWREEGNMALIIREAMAAQRRIDRGEY